MSQISLEQYQRLLTITQTLVAQNDIARLCEIILEEARALTHADGGTLYLVHGHKQQAVLEFAIVRNHSLNIRLGGVDGGEIVLPAVPLFQHGEPNHANVASFTAHTNKLVNIEDAYNEPGFDFSGTKKFDQQFNYQTQSVLTLPLTSSQGELVGVIQLLNAKDSNGATVAFAKELEPLIMALASFAAIALQKQQLAHDQGELLVKLAGEPNTQCLLERIVIEAQNVTNADGGTLYLLRDDQEKPCLEFAYVRNKTLGIALGGAEQTVDLPSIPLYLPEGGENHHHVAAHAALAKKVINIADAYASEKFDFSGTMQFDKQNNYRSTSFLTIPLLNHGNEVIGVLQLVNAIHPQTDAVIPFTEYIEPLAKALASYGAIALNNQLLVEELKNLLDAFIQAIAKAIDAKSPHTSGHCQRVPLLTELIAKAACDDTETFADFHFNEDEWYELKVAAWLHDCGKLATPDSVLDKSTKLQTLYDRLHSVEARFAVLRQQIETDYWRSMVGRSNDDSGLESLSRVNHLEAALAALDDELAFIRAANKGGEFMAEDKKQRVKDIAKRQWRDADGQLQPLLTEDEVYNLCIERGTLTAEERQIINNHMNVTIDILESLPFPRKLKRVPEYAGGHHEKMDGTGFPKGLTREQMSIPARMMAIADIFEALTAKDRPYKAPMPVSVALKILQNMRNDNHIDPDLFELFLRHRVWETYAKQALDPAQLDVTDPTPYM